MSYDLTGRSIDKQFYLLPNHFGPCFVEKTTEFISFKHPF